jgi:hypothetical protein
MPFMIPVLQEETNGRILFSLEGQGVGQHFRIDRHSGQVELISPLDRDPPEGVADWRFMVQATDRDGQGLVGYADVHVQVRARRTGGFINKWGWKEKCGIGIKF